MIAEDVAQFRVELGPGGALQEAIDHLPGHLAGLEKLLKVEAEGESAPLEYAEIAARAMASTIDREVIRRDCVAARLAPSPPLAEPPGLITLRCGPRRTGHDSEAPRRWASAC